ncbi:MAG: tRNA (N6-isopentenyl adenosine(37)-C2)-methylthiotransferase MiaB [Clostridiales bacterium]|nr:tRNA (N6-isopentenyl adenosine(37)-C2)-methylthiotransferase MiaB [Clostridiales bacterium]
MSTYAIQTLGCQMNERDSETIAGLLEQMGYIESADYEDADVIVVNTCSVRENADNRFFGILGRLKHVKTNRADAIVAVCGCMMQQEHITEQIHEKHAWVDIIFGTHNIGALPELIEKIVGGRKGKPLTSVLTERASMGEGLPVRRELSFKASVNIMYGCNNFCTYCIVPYTRGREISRSADDIIAEVRDAAAAGAKEILLLGQNVNSYNGDGIDFADLISMADEVPGIERIRFTTSHPKDLSSKLIDRFGPVKKGGAATLCPSIHLPVQAGSDKVLERMNRRYTKEGYIALVESLRAARPDIVITTDFIVGFPGETEEDFGETMDLIERVRFDSAFTFIYSPRTGTPAAGYDDPTPEDVKHERFDRMVRRLNEITLEKNRAYVGSVQDVLVEGRSKTDAAMLSGRTFGGKLVNFPALASVPASAPEHDASIIGAILPVRIASVKTFSFTGELL